MEGETLTPSIEVVGSEEHGKEQQNPRIRFDGDKEADEFRFPRRVFDVGHSGAISANHLVRVDHGKWKDNADKGKDQEANLQNDRQPLCYLLWISSYLHRFRC